jgi:hypothetical protein
MAFAGPTGNNDMHQWVKLGVDWGLTRLDLIYFFHPVLLLSICESKCKYMLHID